MADPEHICWIGKTMEVVPLIGCLECANVQAAIEAERERIAQFDWYQILVLAMKFKGGGQTRSTIEKVSIEELRHLDRALRAAIRARGEHE